ncbi:response regulator aspartate phosphatase [Bacillus subtilis]|uniref:response regulator aspartate phosphatase n=1 Tax=Bacillus subtilis TaxID=1423 RepID=UPI001B931AE4|nr:tetratricopeptide repeat protein [Bacillus subtilis]CAI6330980.1 Response regulator aspartate phosphatase I [Bacillus subtilis]
MAKNDVIPYDWVATKINHWYKAIKNGWVSKAIEMKKEVEEEKENMEENQNVLLYYQLVRFRHDLMMDYVCPGNTEMQNTALKDIKNKIQEFQIIEGKGKLKLLLEYYYQFFAGMFYFRCGELLSALHYYRQAEKYIDLIEDNDAEVEKAEFYFKLSEVYYHMKQTHFSMSYAMRAYKIYCEQGKTPNDSESYGERKVQCQFVISGNLQDSMRSEDALKHAYQALEDAKELDQKEKNKEHLIRKALFNIGICYNQEENFDQAVRFFKESLQISEPSNNEFSAKVLFMLSYIKGKLNDIEAAKFYYQQSKSIAELHNNEVIYKKLNMVKGLFLSFDLSLVRKTFEFFRERKMYPDMEEYGISVADFLTEKQEILGANEFYRWANEGRKQIKRGEVLYEN